MIIVPAYPDGVPMVPIPKNKPTLFDGGKQELFVFENYEEYSEYINNLYPPPPPNFEHTVSY